MRASKKRIPFQCRQSKGDSTFLQPVAQRPSPVLMKKSYTFKWVYGNAEFVFSTIIRADAMVIDGNRTDF